VAEYTATVSWKRGEGPFEIGRYSRAHRWGFDGGLSVPASASPHSVPPSLCDLGGVDPEEAFVASLSSCHMLWFLAIAARHGLTVDAYEDDAVGQMEQDERGALAMTRVVLRPRIRFSGTPRPDAAALDAMHHEAHTACYIANSVRTVVTVETPKD
jgi:organic hydroperoxide reductase OsmC/OhrA